MTYQCLARISTRYEDDIVVSYKTEAKDSNEAELHFEMQFYIDNIDPDEVIIFDLENN